MTTITKLICPECRYENEAERVYCHGCGARLSKPAAEAAKNEEAQTIETRERLRRLMDNRGVKARQWATNIAKLLLGSCIAAALIQMFLPPDLPAATGKDLVLGPQIGLELENALFQHRGAQLTYREDQVNSYLGTVFKRKKVSLLDKPMLDFEHGIAQFGEGTFRMTLERSFFGLSIYTSGLYRASTQDGKIRGRERGRTYRSNADSSAIDALRRFSLQRRLEGHGTGSQTGGKICRNRISSADGRPDRAGAVIARDRVSDFSDLHESPHSVSSP